MPKRDLLFKYSFTPLVWVPSSDREALRLTIGEHSVFSDLHAWQVRHQWRLELPQGLFANDYSPDLTWQQERAARDALFAQMRPRLFRDRDIAPREDIDFYTKRVLERVRLFHEHPAMANALLVFWDAAERDRTLVKGTPPPRPYATPEERLARFGVPCRGPGWTAAEDDILRRWFGRRTVGPYAGRHAPLSEFEWTIVLDALGRRRTRASVTQRLCTLNDRLRREFVANGWLRNGVATLERAETWLSRVLGERPRRLRTRRRT